MLCTEKGDKKSEKFILMQRQNALEGIHRGEPIKMRRCLFMIHHDRLKISGVEIRLRKLGRRLDLERITRINWANYGNEQLSKGAN